MSVPALIWLGGLDARDLKHSEFRVLFRLCWHHNDEKAPNKACFPSQETLRTGAGVSNGTLNNALNSLEARGLIKRKRSTKPGSAERRTYFLFPFNSPPKEDQTPRTGVSSSEVVKLTPHDNDANSEESASKLQPVGEDKKRKKKNSRETPSAKSDSDVAGFWADKIRNGNYVPKNAVTLAIAQEMIARELVTIEMLEEIGVQV